MTAERFYVAESNLIDGYCVFDREKKYAFHPKPRKADCLNDAHILNELHDENQIKLEIVDAFIRGMEDEKGIDPENVEFQCKLNFTIKVLKKLKKDMLDTTEFKRLKELIE